MNSSFTLALGQRQTALPPSPDGHHGRPGMDAAARQAAGEGPRWALKARNITRPDGQEAIEQSRLIKSDHEILAMTHAIAVAEVGTNAMREALRPGMSESHNSGRCCTGRTSPVAADGSRPARWPPADIPIPSFRNVRRIPSGRATCSTLTLSVPSATAPTSRAPFAAVRASRRQSRSGHAAWPTSRSRPTSPC